MTKYKSTTLNTLRDIVHAVTEEGLTDVEVIARCSKKIPFSQLLITLDKLRGREVSRLHKFLNKEDIYLD